MIARVVENRNLDEGVVHSILFEGGVCEHDTFVHCERIISVEEDVYGVVRAEVEHASGDRFTLVAAPGQMIPFYG